MLRGFAYFECGGRPAPGRLGQVLWQVRWWLWYRLARLSNPHFTKAMVLRTADQLSPEVHSAEAIERIISCGKVALFEPFDRYAKGPWRELSFEANRQAVDFLDDIVATHVPRKLGRFLESYLGKVGGDKYLKKCLLPYVSHKILFFKQIAFLEKAGLVPDIVIPMDRDPLNVGMWLGSSDPMHRCPPLIRAAVSVKDWWPPLVSLAYLAGIFVVQAARVRFRVHRSTADVTMPIVHGFPESGAWGDDRKPNSGDDIFQREPWSRGLNYLYLFTTWQVPEALKQQWQSYIANQPDAILRDTARFRHDLAGFLTILVPLFLRATGLVVRMISGSGRLLACVLIPKFVYVYVREHLMARNVFTRVYISRDDYAGTHIVRTAILNKAGASTIALMHSALVPAQYWVTLRYVHCNTYVINSNAYRSLYAPHWDGADMLVPIGNWRTDVIRRYQNDARVQDRFREKYGNGFFVLALVQDENPASFRMEKLKELYAGILALLEVGNDIKIILRPRRKVFANLPEFRRALESSRVFVELADFNTHELQAMCDMMVAGTASSSGLVEMLSMGKPGVGFNIQGWRETVLSRYNPRLVAETAEDVVQFVTHVYRRGQEGAEIRRAVESFRKDYCEMDDGYVLARLGNVLSAYCGQEGTKAHETHRMQNDSLPGALTRTA